MEVKDCYQFSWDELSESPPPRLILHLSRCYPFDVCLVWRAFCRRCFRIASNFSWLTSSWTSVLSKLPLSKEMFSTRHSVFIRFNIAIQLWHNMLKKRKEKSCLFGVEEFDSPKLHSALLKWTWMSMSQRAWAMSIVWSGGREELRGHFIWILVSDWSIQEESLADDALKGVHCDQLISKSMTILCVPYTLHTLYISIICMLHLQV